VSGRAGDGAGGGVDSEVVQAVPADHRGLQRRRLDEQLVPGLGQGIAAGVGGVGGVGKDLQVARFVGQQLQGDGGLVVFRARARGEPGCGDQSDLRLDDDVSLEAFLPVRSRAISSER
jgi:hypothetical protein